MSGSKLLAFVRTPFHLFLNGPATPWVPLGFHVPILVGAVVWNVMVATPVSLLLGLPVAGLLLWTLVEYVMHAYPLHKPYRHPALRFLRGQHGEHHDAPNDPAQFFVRPAMTVPAAGLFWCLFRLLLPSWHLAALPVAGLAAGYLAYELIHYAIHMLPNARLLRPLVSHHFHHHYADPQRCFGVTSPLWDIVFRTGRRTTEERVASKHAAV